MKKYAVLILTALLALQLAGCSQGNSEASSSAASAEQMVMDEAVLPGEAVLPNVEMPAGSNQKIIWHVDMRLETTDFEASLSGITESIRSLGGYTESSTVNGSSLLRAADENDIQATIVARIPPKMLDPFLSSVDELCNVVNSSRESENITQQYTDIEMRKKSLEIEEERLLSLLEKADNLENIIQLESRLSDVRYKIDNFSSSLRGYDNLVDYSTVYLKLIEVRRVSEPIPVTMGEKITSGLSDTWYAIRTGGQNLIIWIVVNLPYLLILAVVFLLVYLMAKRLLRKKKTAKSARSVTQSSDENNPTHENFYRSTDESEHQKTTDGEK